LKQTPQDFRTNDRAGRGKGGESVKTSGMSTGIFTTKIRKTKEVHPPLKKKMAPKHTQRSGAWGGGGGRTPAKGGPQINEKRRYHILGDPKLIEAFIRVFAARTKKKTQKTC